MQMIEQPLPVDLAEAKMLPAPPIAHMDPLKILKCEENDTVGVLYKHRTTELYMYLVLHRGRDVGMGGSKYLETTQESMLKRMNSILPDY
jgi:hypothetical protein